METIQDGVKEAGHRAARTAENAANNGKELANTMAAKSAAFAQKAVDKGLSYARQAADKGAELSEMATQKGADAIQASENFIKENPHASVGSGFGVGVLIGGLVVFLLMKRD